MAGEFPQGTLLWYWYDSWIVVPAFVAMVALTLLVMARTAWTRVLPLAVKAVAVVATVLVAIAVVDRLGASFTFPNPQAFGYGTIAAAVITLAIGLATLRVTRSTRYASEGTAPAGTTGTIGGQGQATGETAVVTPEEGTRVTAFQRTGDEDPTAVPGPQWHSQTGGEDPTAMPGPRSGMAQPTGGPGGSEPPAQAAADTAVTHAAQSPPPPPASLTQRTGPEAGQTYQVTADTVGVGRSRDNTLVLTDPSVSRHHCRITRSGSGYQVEDLGSSAGTLVDGTRIGGPVPLRPGSVLRLGETELAFQGPSASTTGAAPATEAPTAAAAPQAAPQGGGTTMVMGREPGAPAWLLVRSGSHAGRSFALSGERVDIGRDPDNAVVLDDAAVSRHHALFTVQEGRFVLRDIGSRGGTQVNGRPVGGLPLREGSRLALGSSELVFSEVSGQQAPAAGAGGETAVLRPQGRGALLVRSGPSAGRSFTLGEQDLVIGREPGGDGAQLDDPSVSRRHALVRRSGEQYEVFDLGSANGTLVDGARVEGRELGNGDVVRIGQTELQFVKAEGQ